MPVAYAVLAGKQAQAGIWAVLDDWSAKGHMSTLMRRYTQASWFEQGRHQPNQLAQELYSEAEMRLISGFAFMTHRKLT